mgnify:CR=1 FL=1
MASILIFSTFLLLFGYINYSSNFDSLTAAITLEVPGNKPKDILKKENILINNNSIEIKKIKGYVKYCHNECRNLQETGLFIYNNKEKKFIKFGNIENFNDYILNNSFVLIFDFEWDDSGKILENYANITLSYKEDKTENFSITGNAVKNTNNSGILFFIIFIVLFLLFGIFYLHRKNKKKNLKIKIMNKKLVNLYTKNQLNKFTI